MLILEEFIPMADLKGVSITWLGHAAVLLTTAQGTNILIDPFLEHNPKFPKGFQLPDKIDLLLLSHGHMDHIADAVVVAKKHGATAIGTFELISWIQSKGVKQAVPMNIGGSFTQGDVTVSLTEARHSSGIQDGDRVIYGGEPTGLVMTMENGPVVYHAGDTSVFSDMQLIRDLYHPQIAMLPIGDHFTMGPKAAAVAAKYIGAQAVLPIHWGTFPQLTGTPDAFEKELAGSGVEMIRTEPGAKIA